METFVREAIARAAFERAESEKVGGGGGGWSGGFLEVSWLEGWYSWLWANVLVV